jgi:ketosteroid isomerase-like protein
MTDQPQAPLVVLQRLYTAMNQHDLEEFLDCIDPDYQSEQPVHPNRQFSGQEQVRKNWSGIFDSIPDFSVELLRAVSDGNRVWAEWDWQGTGSDENLFHMRGVTIFEVRNDRITSGRLYMESVEHNGSGIDAHNKAITTGEESG